MTAWVDRWALGLAWAFVGLRIVHSIVHLTCNHVGQRAIVFGVGNFVVLGMWGLFVWRVYG
ncbi:MAG: MAPEG family protein [Rhizomicrobium sp.]